MTVLPVRVRGDVDEGDMLGSSLYFPVAGLLQGAVLAGVGYGLMHLFGPTLVAALLIGLAVLTNGGFHLDGLADTADALACKGDVPRRLEVMRDGAVGPVGAMAMFLTLIIKYAALSELISAGGAVLVMGVLFMPVLCKWAMLAGMRMGRPARNDGLGRIFIGRVSTPVVVATGLLVMFLMVACVMLAGWGCEPLWHALPAAALAIALAIAFTVNRICLRVFGGQSGDTLGATGELVEAGYLIIVSLWSSVYI